MSDPLGTMEGMEDLATRLAALEQLARAIASDVLGSGSLRTLDERVLVEVLTATGRTQRLVEAVQIEAVGEVEDRNENPTSDGRLVDRFGCHNVSELVQRTTMVSPASAARMAKAAKAIRRPASLTTGELFEPELPALRSAVRDGVVGVDGALAIAVPLLAAGLRASRAQLCTADAVLAAEARGEGPDGAPPACADLLRVQAQVWATALDPDGAEPRERAAMHKRGLTLGTETEHGVPIRGMLMHEVAAQFQRIADAALNPRVDPDALPGVRFTEVSDHELPERPYDPRTRAQKLHDVFAMTLSVAASSELLPTIGGAAPTLVVSVREQDLVRGRGYAHVEGTTEPVALTAATRVACAGVVQRVVTDHHGRIHSLGTEERVFNRHQRRAIAVRDGGCIIPGCGVRAGWCEVHHVTEWAHGGLTHTDNGVLLCWYHHRFIDFSGWKIRMNSGAPEVRAPNWIDSHGRWRPATTSPTRLLNAVMRT
jgi:hypothetical protein